MGETTFILFSWFISSGFAVDLVEPHAARCRTVLYMSSTGEGAKRVIKRGPWTLSGLSLALTP